MKNDPMFMFSFNPPLTTYKIELHLRDTILSTLYLPLM